MKRILCYGDSNTWGYIPVSGDRYDEERRWTMLLQKAAGDAYRIIEEGLNGRTTVFDDPIGPGRNGLEYLKPCLQSHAPLDLVIVMLGTNDLKRRFNLSAEEIAQGMEMLIDAVDHGGTGPGAVASGGKKPEVLILSPPVLERVPVWNYAFMGMEEKSRQLGELYGRLAKRKGCGFLDIGSHVEAGGADGIHLTEENHRRIAELVVSKISEII
jgi:lysophospholipase L1-like esterase